MRSPEASLAKHKGFTLTELVLVMALFSVAAGTAYPLGKTFYDRYIFNEAAAGISSALETTAMRAMTQLRDSDHGVKLLSDSYVLFQGASYADRVSVHDQVVSIPATMTQNGIDEVVFSQRSGAPHATGTITLGYNGRERTVHITAVGVIE